MKIFSIKLVSVVLIIALFGSCMTVTPDNRDEAVTELTKLRRASVSRSPMVSAIGPTYTINALRNNAALMLAGQLGMQLGYEYFVILDRQVTQHISGVIYRGTGGINTTTMHSITVSYTNDESHEGRFAANISSSLLDGYNFTTRNGRIASGSLFGGTAILGAIIMLSSLSLDFDDPRVDRRLIGGGVLMSISPLFTIPLFR